MNEASKTKNLLSSEEIKLFRGKGIDIGCGNDPIDKECERFDMDDGDANEIAKYVRDIGEYDYVFSAHCLEHMSCPKKTIQEWWKLVKIDGVMIIIVPDEDLYEQGYWPSLFNNDHKATFTISKKESWSPVSNNLLDLAKQLDNSKILSVRLQDYNYERKFLRHATWPRIIVKLSIRLRFEIWRHTHYLFKLVNHFFLLVGLPIDQTLTEACAQNILIVKKVCIKALQQTRNSLCS